MFSNNFNTDDHNRASIDLEMHTYVQLMTNNPADTIASCTQTIERTTNHEELATAHLYRGSAYMRTGSYAAAEDDLRLAISFAGHGMQRVHAFTNLGLLFYSVSDSLFYYFSDNPTRAHEALTLAILSFPHSAIFPLPYIYRSMINAKKKNFAEALADLKLAGSAKCFDHNDKLISLAIARINYKSDTYSLKAKHDFDERIVGNKFHDLNFGNDVFETHYEKYPNPDKFLFEKYTEAVHMQITTFPWEFCKYLLTPECPSILRKTAKEILYTSLLKAEPQQPELADFFLKLMSNEKIKKLEFNPETIFLTCHVRANANELKIMRKIAKARLLVTKEINKIIWQQTLNCSETLKTYIVSKIGVQPNSLKASSEPIDNAKGKVDIFERMTIAEVKPAVKQSERAWNSQRPPGLTFFPGMLAAVPIPETDEEKETTLESLRTSNAGYLHPLM